MPQNHASHNHKGEHTVAIKLNTANLDALLALDTPTDYARPKRTTGFARTGAQRNFSAKMLGLKSALGNGEVIIVDDSTLADWQTARYPSSDRIDACGGNVDKAGRATVAHVIAGIVALNRKSVAGTGKPLYLFSSVDEKGNAVSSPVWDYTAKMAGCDALGFGGRVLMIARATLETMREEHAADAADAE